MDIQTLLEWTDKQVLEKTGKHLDSLQESILQGIWEHQDYEEIAKDNQRSYDHIKKEAWKLWQLLSDVFEEDIGSYLSAGFNLGNTLSDAAKNSDQHLARETTRLHLVDPVVESFDCHPKFCMCSDGVALKNVR